jgi:hypothetical protein
MLVLTFGAGYIPAFRGDITINYALYGMQKISSKCYWQGSSVWTLDSRRAARLCSRSTIQILNSTCSLPYNIHWYGENVRRNRKAVAADTFLPLPQMTPEEQKQFQSIAEKHGQKLYPQDYLD